MSGIYRGAGGPGDATTDAASEALLIKQLAIEVQADADDAAASAAAALVSENNAASSETAAASSATAAASSASTASTQATNASNSASAASTSATNAETSATAAQTAETNAETAETNAAGSASLAQDWAIKVSGPVSGSNYSSKYNANLSAASASAAASSESAASTSATSASNSASAAATSATNAANSATAAAGSATSASSSASSASTSASNAATSATNAASSASTATTQAGIATTQATNAASSASAASTSATNAASSATAASTSASNSATSATNASNSATAAATSETNAAASAAAAAASYDSFDDRYLGSKSAAPTLDNDGNALVVGALYYNNGIVTPADKGMYVYDGAVWIPASAASSAILVTYKYTATAGQTTFSGSDDNALTLSYTAGSIIVTLNGVVLEVPSEATASNGSSVVLASSASAGDELNVYAFATFDIANVYTKAETDAFAVKLTGAQTVAGVKTFSSQPVFSAGIDLSSNGQIKFPATQNASSDANTLDDYEEGTWTPTLTFGGGSTGITYNSRAGYYTKIGSLVNAYCYVYLSNKGSSTSTVLIEGLPFTSGGNSGQYASVTVWATGVTTSGQIMSYLDPNSVKTILINYNPSTGVASALQSSSFTNTSEVMINVTYRTV